MLLGCHLSIRGGVDKSIDRANELGINALQIFSHNPRQWRFPPLKEQEKKLFYQKRQQSNLKYITVHTSYLINLASPDHDLRHKSVKLLKQEIARADQLSIGYVVTHIGAYRRGGIDGGIKRATKALSEIGPFLNSTKTGVKLLLENTAGAGTTLGYHIEQIGSILEGTSVEDDLFGFCFDTAHGLAAGYDIATQEGLEETLAQMESTLPHWKLQLIHLNDSKYEMGSRKDRHEHIGRGHIGLKGFKNIINHPKLADLPYILETPKNCDNYIDADRFNLDQVLNLSST